MHQKFVQLCKQHDEASNSKTGGPKGWGLRWCCRAALVLRLQSLLRPANNCLPTLGVRVPASDACASGRARAEDPRAASAVPDGTRRC